MRKVLNLLVMGMLLIISCEKEKESVTRITASDCSGNFKRIEGVEVWFYSNEQDYLLQQNAGAHGFTNSQGQFSVPDPGQTFKWKRLKKGKLNGLRNSPSGKGGVESIWYGKDVYFEHSGKLSTTPVKLQLNLKKNGQPVEGLWVSLYFSEENIRKFENPSDQISDDDPLHGSALNSKVRLGEFTDAEGVAYFDQLIPDTTYLVVIRKGSSSYTPPASMVPVSIGPLPDNMDITTVRDVGVE